jgi:murein L,D-transpeptidase YcbB/YkuD
VLRSTVTVLAVFGLAAFSLAATPAKPKKHRHAATGVSSTTTHKHSGTSKGTGVKGAQSDSRRKGKGAGKGKTSRIPPRSYQQAPTADRYKEIQQALAGKGYLHTEPSGHWDAESADALKRFQSDQNLMPDGKIGSLSLIALGLGPKRLTAKSDPAPSVAPPAAAASEPASPSANPSR